MPKKVRKNRKNNRNRRRSCSVDECNFKPRSDKIDAHRRSHRLDRTKREHDEQGRFTFKDLPSGVPLLPSGVPLTIGGTTFHAIGGTNLPTGVPLLPSGVPNHHRGYQNLPSGVPLKMKNDTESEDSESQSTP